MPEILEKTRDTHKQKIVVHGGLWLVGIHEPQTSTNISVLQTTSRPLEVGSGSI